ncbi:MAG: hypothetical protein H6819_01420 [Phycisphaerales bacterium]|nr:hypothetical protein [Phycisphaerales bacterium]MCB9857132.1 hypothetical protein [Phycisphaerales bacterium]MCB9861741.1 hypothetical protein [Phycisphaerales bacterium]
MCRGIDTSTPQGFFDFLRVRPGMMIGEKSFRILRAFLYGYETATSYYDVNTTNDPLIIPAGMHDWASYRLHVYGGSGGWQHAISTSAQSDEEAFDLFMQLYDEFRNRKPHVVARVVGFQKTINRGSLRKLDGKWVQSDDPRESPTSMSLVTYTDDPGFFLLSDTDVEIPVQSFYRSIEEFEECSTIARSVLTIVDPDWNYGIVED